MDNQQTDTTHYFDGTQWLKATEKSCENCNNYTSSYGCDMPEADRKDCLSSKYRNFWNQKEEPKTDRTCETCVNFTQKDKNIPPKFSFCRLADYQTKECLSSLIRQFWHKKKETVMNENSKEIQAHEKEFNETLGFDARQDKKIKGTEIKPTNVVINEHYKLSLKDLRILLRKSFDLNPNDEIWVYLSGAKYGKVIEVEIERNK